MREDTVVMVELSTRDELNEVAALLPVKEQARISWFKYSQEALLEN